SGNPFPVDERSEGGVSRSGWRVERAHPARWTTFSPLWSARADHCSRCRSSPRALEAVWVFACGRHQSTRCSTPDVYAGGCGTYSPAFGQPFALRRFLHLLSRRFGRLRLPQALTGTARESSCAVRHRFGKELHGWGSMARCRCRFRGRVPNSANRSSLQRAQIGGESRLRRGISRRSVRLDLRYSVKPELRASSWNIWTVSSENWVRSLPSVDNFFRMS